MITITLPKQYDRDRRAEEMRRGVGRTFWGLSSQSLLLASINSICILMDSITPWELPFPKIAKTTMSMTLMAA